MPFRLRPTVLYERALSSGPGSLYLLYPVPSGFSTLMTSASISPAISHKQGRIESEINLRLLCLLVHPKIVQERLGHSTIAVTLDTYSHVAPGLQEAAAKRFDEVFSARYNEPESETVEKLGWLFVS